MGTTAQIFYMSTAEQDFTAAGEVDIRAFRTTVQAANSTTICAHANSAGTTQITLDPYTNRNTVGDIRANAGWAIDRLGSDGMDSLANNRRRIAAGTWNFALTAAIPQAGTATGSLTLSIIIGIYRVSSAGARTLITSATGPTTINSTGLTVGGTTGTVGGNITVPEIILEPNESIHVGIISNMVQVAGLLGATVAGTATYTVGNLANMTVTSPGVRTLYDRSLSDSPAVADSLSRTAIFPRALSDAAPISDSLSRTYTGSRTFSDSPSVTDQLSRVAIFPRTLTDSAPVVDSITRQFIANRNLNDSAPVMDVLSRIFSGNRALSDTPVVNDSLSRTVTYNRTIQDNLAEGGGETILVIPVFSTIE